MLDKVEGRGVHAPWRRFLARTPWARQGSRDDASATLDLDIADPTERPRPPRTDIGTILLHWFTVIVLVTSLLTGLRIAADAPEAPISKALTPILPQGEIWTFHFAAGLALFFCVTAYLFYLRRSGLFRRVALKRLLAFTLPTGSKLRWAAFNVGSYWLLYGLIVILTATGVFLYLGYGGWLVTVHNFAAFGTVAYIVMHVLGHFGYGGLAQILRLFRPSKLAFTAATRPLPLLVGTVSGLLVAAALAGLDFGSRGVLKVVPVDAAPKPDGRLDEAVWQAAPAVSIETQQGVNLAGTGASRVEVRAVRHQGRIYFAFRWWDPTRSLWRLPLQKQADGWHVLQDRAATADVNTFYEDKFSVVFSSSQAFGGGDSTHLGAKPLADKPRSFHERGYHYTNDGSVVDVWQWKSSRGGMLGRVDDQHFGAPRSPSPAHTAGKKRYKAGYASDPGKAFYLYNYKAGGPKGFAGPVGVRRLPRDLAAVRAAMGAFELDSNTSVAEGSKWWMLEKDTVPYSAEADAKIPVGTVIPGVVIVGKYEGDRADVRGGARWENGYWTLETSRALETGSKYDAQFTRTRDLHMWVAVFDHTQIRHTRHARPVTVTLN